MDVRVVVRWLLWIGSSLCLLLAWFVIDDRAAGWAAFAGYVVLAGSSIVRAERRREHDSR